MFYSIKFWTNWRRFKSFNRWWFFRFRTDFHFFFFLQRRRTRRTILWGENLGPDSADSSSTLTSLSSSPSSPLSSSPSLWSMVSSSLSMLPSTFHLLASMTSSSPTLRWRLTTSVDGDVCDALKKSNDDGLDHFLSKEPRLLYFCFCNF